MLVRRFKIEGCSMETTFHPGEIVFVRRYFNKPKAGDVIVFNHPKGKMIKRIVKIKNGKYFVKGDNIETSESVIDRKDIIGKAILKR